MDYFTPVSGFRKCTRCKHYLPLEVFNHAKQYKGNVDIYCKKCRVEKKGRVWHPECLMPDGYRQCGICNQVLPYDRFNKNKNCKGGLSNKCRACSNTYDAEYLDAHREENKAYGRKRYIEKRDDYIQYKKEHAAEIAQQKRDWRKAHPELVRKHKADSAKRHPESQKRRLNRYYSKYPVLKMMRGRIQGIRRRTKMDIERTLLNELYEEQEGKCAYCGISIFWEIPNDIHVDHITALSKGGTNDRYNLNLTCKDCNLSKNDSDLLEWMQQRGW